MKMRPKYEHTISEIETDFLGNEGGVDYYYRKSIFPTIDLRHSDDPSDYTSWIFPAIDKAYEKDMECYSKVIPVHIYERAKILAGVY